MKMVIIGGTGLIGPKLVEQLGRDGHETLAASPQALEGAQVVLDVSDGQSSDNLLATELAARVGHHITLSVVGADRLAESAYFRAKLAQEEAVTAGPVPYTIVRATQFFEHIGRMTVSGTDTVRLPPALVRPVAADDVASALADVAVGSPLNDTVELAGPEAFRLDELTRRAFEASGDPRQVTTDVHARYLGAVLDDRSLLPGDDARIASTRFEDWISRSS